MIEEPAKKRWKKDDARNFSYFVRRKIWELDRRMPGRGKWKGTLWEKEMENTDRGLYLQLVSPENPMGWVFSFESPEEAHATLKKCLPWITGAFQYFFVHPRDPDPKDDETAPWPVRVHFDLELERDEPDEPGFRAFVSKFCSEVVKVVVSFAEDKIPRDEISVSVCDNSRVLSNGMHKHSCHVVVPDFRARAPGMSRIVAALLENITPGVDGWPDFANKAIDLGVSKRRRFSNMRVCGAKSDPGNLDTTSELCEMSAKCLGYEWMDGRAVRTIDRELSRVFDVHGNPLRPLHDEDEEIDVAMPLLYHDHLFACPWEDGCVRIRGDAASSGSTKTRTTTATKRKRAVTSATHAQEKRPESTWVQEQKEVRARFVIVMMIKSMARKLGLDGWDNIDLAAWRPPCGRASSDETDPSSRALREADVTGLSCPYHCPTREPGRHEVHHKKSASYVVVLANGWLMLCCRKSRHEGTESKSIRVKNIGEHVSAFQ